MRPEPRPRPWDRPRAQGSAPSAGPPGVSGLPGRSGRSDPWGASPLARPRAVAAGAKSDPPTHGAHTLRRVRGTVVGVDRGDVFVDLGPRQQGLIAAARFQPPPSVGDTFEFTLRGQEDGLWRLELAGARTLADWEQMRPGLLVEARITGLNPGGFELKIGPLHGFMPRSHSGLGRRDRPRTLLGKTLPVEVLEVDRERERVLVSRKLVLRAERGGGRARESVALRPGQVVEGRVSRLAPFGAFVRIGTHLEGLVHLSNLAHERVEDAGAVLSVGQRVLVRVLSVRADGKRIGLGLKQVDPSPWPALEAAARRGDVQRPLIVRVEPTGLVLRFESGVEGFAPRSELGLDHRAHLRQFFHLGTHLAVRVLEADGARERLIASRLHADGSPVSEEEWEADPHPFIERERDGDCLWYPAPQVVRERPPEPGRAVRLAQELLREVREIDAELDAEERLEDEGRAGGSTARAS